MAEGVRMTWVGVDVVGGSSSLKRPFKGKKGLKWEYGIQTYFKEN